MGIGTLGHMSLLHGKGTTDEYELWDSVEFWES